MMEFRPSSGVILPFSISQTPKMIGNLRSLRYDLFILRRIFSSENAVSTPSATSVEDRMMSFSFSPLPMRIPKFRFRERGPKHVPNVSPTPDRPDSVDARPPSEIEILLISTQPRVTRAAIAFVPRPSPSLIPAARAMTFLTAPPTSRPMTSRLVKTRNERLLINSDKSLARVILFEAITTAVAFPSIISRAKEGPERNA
mmetsp:Transcript_87569/g.175186  ORF Transcript_87569/g.175186 Transcript_87569/m.175186 type:complete len:200 (+) Transcript_87569:345-944(+)